MAKENYDEVIDQKLSELYEVLKALNTLKEKTTAVRDVVSGLAEAGKGRVAEIEEAVGRLGEGIDGRIADVGKSMDAVATRVNAAVENAGKERLESIRITAETFSKSLSDLVQAANDGTAKMSKAVAELRGLPFVEELRSIREDGVKQAAELKAAVESVEVTAKSVLPEIGTLGAKLGTEAQKLSKSVSDASDRLKAAIESVSGGVKKAQSGIESNRAVLTEAFVRQEKQLKDSTSRVLDRLNDLSVALKDARESLESDAQKALSALTEAKEAVVEGISGLKVVQEESAKNLSKTINECEAKLVEEAERTRKRITGFGIAVLLAVALVGMLVAPAAVGAWKALVK